MIGLTKFSLKRPVTLILALVTVLYFGITSVLSSPMELIPDMNLPMIVISTIYVGATPEEIDELVTKPIESNVSTQAGIDSVTSSSSENASMVLLQYEYGTNMDTAYLELRKALDIVKNQLPEDAGDPTIYEMDIKATPAMTLAVMGGTDRNLYNYVNDTIVPEIEKIAEVGEVSISGGRENYVSIELKPEKMAQYNLSMSTIAALVGAADFSVPAGDVDYGTQELSLIVSANYKDIDRIRNIVIPLATGDVIHLSDVADVKNTLEETTSISRYNGEPVVRLSISKQQSASSVDISKKVNRTIEKLKAQNSTLDIRTVYDSSTNIKSSLTSVFETLLIAVVLAMFILFLFFGDIKASLIVGSSIPVSVLITLTLMSAAGFTLNIVSVGSLALGVGMIVDNSIVVIENCFRVKEKNDFKETAIKGTETVIGSIFGSTATTCVVFLPLALLQGLTGQIFKQLGFTIVFCMISSFFSAVTIVPMLYFFTKPVEKEESPVGKIMRKLQDWYRDLVRWIIPKKKEAIIITVLLFALSIVMISQLGFELMPNIDEGMVNVNIDLKPGLKINEVDKILTAVEDYVAEDPDVERYQVSSSSSGIMSSSSGASVTAYLKKKRSRKTIQVVKDWTRDLTKFTDSTIQVSNGSSTGMSMLNTSSVTVDLVSTDYELLKKTTDEIAEALRKEPYVTQVHSSSENSAPVVRVEVDPVKAEAWGLTPVQVASTVYMNLSGSEVMNYTDGGSEIKVRLEYPEDEFETIDDVKAMQIPTMAGTTLCLEDIADVYFQDSAKSISRSNKQYQVSITAQIPEGYEDTATTLANEFVDKRGLPDGVTRQTDAYQEMISDELGGLFKAIMTAVFLVFIVMAMQFESPRLSIMVMFTVPFSMIGAFGLLYAFNIKLSMPSMMGLLMMVGTVVNNGILYVDTANQYREEMPLFDALVEAGATRIRPMFMTTLTTILAMLPMACAFGNSGELMQGLALVNIGGLVTSTVLTLLLLPTVYQIFDKRKEVA